MFLYKLHAKFFLFFMSWFSPLNNNFFLNIASKMGKLFPIPSLFLIFFCPKFLTKFKCHFSMKLYIYILFKEKGYEKRQQFLSDGMQ